MTRGAVVSRFRIGMAAAARCNVRKVYDLRVVEAWRGILHLSRVFSDGNGIVTIEAAHVNRVRSMVEFRTVE